MTSSAADGGLAASPGATPFWMPRGHRKMKLPARQTKTAKPRIRSDATRPKRPNFQEANHRVAGLLSIECGKPNVSTLSGNGPRSQEAPRHRQVADGHHGAAGQAADGPRRRSPHETETKRDDADARPNPSENNPIATPPTATPPMATPPRANTTPWARSPRAIHPRATPRTDGSCFEWPNRMSSSGRPSRVRWDRYTQVPIPGRLPKSFCQRVGWAKGRTRQASSRKRGRLQRSQIAAAPQYRQIKAAYKWRNPPPKSWLTDRK